MNRMSKIVISLLSLALASTSALALDNGWPRTLSLDEGMVTIYAPQVEAMDGGVLYYRAALAYRPKADAEPIFGAGWLKAPIEVDEAGGIVHPTRLELTQTRFPEGTTDIQAELATALLRQSAAWNLDFPVDQLEAALDAAEAESLAAQKLKTAPPRIIYRDHPALLVTIDGEPVLREIENSPYRAVVNTPFPLITDGDLYYLNAAKGVWYRAEAATGPYRFDASPPQGIVQMVEDAEATTAAETRPEEVAPKEPVTAETAPEIVVSTEPAELIVTEGPADFVPLVDDLLVLQNSDDDVFMHVGKQKYYIVLAGRWYQANSLNGPWEYQAADTLPAAFAEIPEDSAQSDSRVYVAGTPEAEEAVLDAQVPQTAAVKRGEVDIEVEYDGDPDFDRVDGTEDLRYARNTGATVIESDRSYYLLEDGVWYVSSSPHGPWVVSDHRPGELDAIQPSSPVYNTKYVHVYHSTPEVVYVGYTPGYLGSYVHYNTIVYGTGWYYRPWVSPHYYYPRHRTWGFHVGYADWGGWSYGLGWYWPYYSLNYYYGGYWHHGRPWHHRHWGYWGPLGYRYRPYYYSHGYRHHDYGNHDKGYGRGYGHHGRHDKFAYRDDGGWDNVYRRDGRWSDRYGRERHRNLYRDDQQRARVSETYDRWRNERDRRDEPGRRNTGKEQRFVDNRKVRQSSTGPVRPADLRMKAKVRDVNRAANREPMVADNRGEVYRASFNNGGPREARRNSRPVDAAARRDQELVARRDAENRVTQRSAQRSKVRESRTEPVTGSDLRARATAKDKVRQNRTAPVTRDEMRARAVARDNQRENRVTPISREDLRRRADLVEKRNDEARKPSVNRPLPKPSRSVDHSRRQITSPPREVASRAQEKRPGRQVTSPPRQVTSRAPENRVSRQLISPPRRAASQAPVTRPERQVASPPRKMERRAPDRGPSRQISAPSRREPAPARPQVRAPQRQMNQAPSRPHPAASPSRRSEARPDRSRSERSAPRRQKAERSDSPPERGKPREQHRRN